MFCSSLGRVLLPAAAPQSARATRRRHSAWRGLPALQAAGVGAAVGGLATVFRGLGGVGHEAWLDFTKPVLGLQKAQASVGVQHLKRGPDGPHCYKRLRTYRCELYR